METTRYFTYLWTNESWIRKTALAREGYWHLDYAAGNRFRSAGVAPGSVVFIITVIRGSLFLGGYIEVEAVLDRENAAKFLGQYAGDLRNANEFIVARPGSEVVFRGDLKVDDAIAKSLGYRTKSGELVYPKQDAEGRIDRQTLRNVRRLFTGTEKKLFALM